MRKFRDIPIRQKLLIVTLATTTTALLLAGVGNVLVDSFLFRSYLSRDLGILARVIADNSTAALSFIDPVSATQTLSALKERSHITGACIYRNGSGENGRNASGEGGRDPSGKGEPRIFAEYAPGRSFSCPQVLKRNENPDRPPSLALSEPIVLDGRQIGTLVVFYDLGELNERVRLYSGLIVGVFLASMVIALLLSNRLRTAITAPIAHLLRATKLVAATDDYRVRAEKLSDDELGVLVDHFNEMLTRIQLRTGEVERERARFQFMAECMPQKIVTAKPSGEIDYLNRQWLDYAGMTFDEMKEWGWTRVLHPEDFEESVRLWKQSLESGESFHFQQRFRRKDGRFCWHLSRAEAMRDSSGKITMWIGSSTDIHEQKEKEEELRRLNQDLEQFAYSASHDLQEPIRNVSVFSEIIARRYASVLDEEGQMFLGFLREGGHRLARLVDDLLAYTRASTAELNEYAVDASAVLERALATLTEPIRQAGAIVTADKLPEVNMGDVHLQQVFQNLVGNAVKYRSDEPPRIYISARRMGASWCFSVRDNGIGIDPAYKELIFGVFKRLSHDRKHSGTGIGLAICQRVVERYGGRIWVESEIGKGATFFFTVRERAESIHPAAVQSSGG